MKVKTLAADGSADFFQYAECGEAVLIRLKGQCQYYFSITSNVTTAALVKQKINGVKTSQDYMQQTLNVKKVKVKAEKHMNK